MPKPPLRNQKIAVYRLVNRCAIDLVYELYPLNGLPSRTPRISMELIQGSSEMHCIVSKHPWASVPVVGQAFRCGTLHGGGDAHVLQRQGSAASLAAAGRNNAVDGEATSAEMQVDRLSKYELSTEQLKLDSSHRLNIGATAPIAMKGASSHRNNGMQLVTKMMRPRNDDL